MLNKSVCFAVLAFVCMITAAFALGGSSFRTHRAKQITLQASDRFEAELLVLRQKGFEPTEIRRPQGPFLLIVHNQSEVEATSLVLRREAGASLKVIAFRQRQAKLRERIDLPLGQYVLTEQNHPNWLCRIIITAQ